MRNVSPNPERSEMGWVPLTNPNIPTVFLRLRERCMGVGGGEIGAEEVQSPKAASHRAGSPHCVTSVLQERGSGFTPELPGWIREVMGFHSYHALHSEPSSLSFPSKK